MTPDENCLPCPALPGEYTPSPQGRAGFTFLGQCSQLVGYSLSRLKPSPPGAPGPGRLGEGPVECSGVRARASMRVGSLDSRPVGLRGGGRSARRRRGLAVTGHLAPPLSLRVKDRVQPTWGGKAIPHRDATPLAPVLCWSHQQCSFICEHA